MSPLRRMRARPPGGVPRAAARMVASTLVLVIALLLVRASTVATARDTGSDVCVGPVPVGGSCTSTSTTTSSTSRGTSQSTSTVSTSTTGTQTETTTSTGSSETPGGTTT